MCFCPQSQKKRELYIHVAAGDDELWLLSPRPSPVTANSSHRQIAPCIPRGCERNQTVTCTQVDPNQHPVFECHPLMWWVANISRSEASQFLFDGGFGQIVTPCRREWNHIKGLRARPQIGNSRHRLSSALQRFNSALLRKHFPWSSRPVCQIHLNKAAAFFTYWCHE